MTDGGSLREIHRNSLILRSDFSGAHLAGGPKRVHTIVNAARNSACATICINQITWHDIKGPDVSMLAPVGRALPVSGGLLDERQ
jgi:hypothetical protein